MADKLRTTEQWVKSPTSDLVHVAHLVAKITLCGHRVSERWTLGATDVPFLRCVMCERKLESR